MKTVITALLAGLISLHSTPIAAATVAVRHREGLVHGFLELSTLEGKALADGDVLQTSKGDTVMLAITPKPRLVKLEFTPAAKEAFATGGKGREATRDGDTGKEGLVACNAQFESTLKGRELRRPDRKARGTPRTHCGTQATSNDASRDASALDTFELGVTGH